ncbi:MAG: NHLP leader peptide family RiPP precursor [Gemmataceae bacterium]
MAQQHPHQWAEVVLKCWQDPAFKARLVADPHAVLQEHGIAVRPGVQLKLVENSDTVKHLILPSKPVELDLSKLPADGLTAEELARIHAGGLLGVTDFDG